MPLSVLLPLVVFGITLIVVLVRVMAPTPALVLDDEGAVRAIWDRRHPDLPARAVRLDEAGHHALVLTEAGPGIVWTLGADPVTRVLPKGTRVRETGTGLLIDLGDFTAPRLSVALTMADARRDWARELEGVSA
jgi:hypothetical protein